jgi:hypothetical protein
MAVQAFNMRSKWPGFRRSGNDRSSTWRGQLQPHELSPAYDLSAQYTIPKPPKIKVLSPPINPQAPHLFDDDKSLCLYWPEEWRWHAHRMLADTILPWAALWLYFYELWLATGEWLGPSAPHAPRGKGPDQQRA